MKKVCIVTPDFIGPINNGGIGTHCFFLASELVEKGFDVTVLFTVPCQVKDNLFWKRHYQKLNITFISIYDISTKEPITSSYPFLVDSFKVSEFLKKHHFSFIHFQDWRANGFYTIQAKKTTDDFSRSVITVTMHSSTQWTNQGMRRWNHYPFYETKLEWCERYCVRNADILISSSQYMFSWAAENGWLLADNRQVIPYCYRAALEKRDAVSAAPQADLSHLIFFGRLETRKGLEYFSEELLLTARENPSAIGRVSFVGKIGETGRGPANTYISEVLGKKIKYSIYSDFDTFQALEFILNAGGIVIVPSLLDNFPYTVVECIENKIPVLASNTGGIPEMLNEKALFTVAKKGALRDRILSLEEHPLGNIRHNYSSMNAKRGWLKLHDTPVTSSPQIGKRTNPLVSICIAYYNHGRYLPQLFRSIKNLDYDNYQVITVNDGSTDRQSNEVFNSLEKEYSSSNWVYYRKENTGLGHTRNYAVSKANGEYVIFMDADNVATRNMVNDFLLGMKATGADCLTCHLYSFAGDLYIEGGTEPVDRYMPIGPALEIGILENIFGDANFIVRKDVFRDLGGFNEDKITSWGDWDFLARLSLKGYKQEVVPRPLFWYRRTPGSMSSNTDEYSNHRTILKTYSENSPPYTRFMLESLLFPHYHHYNYNGYPVPGIYQQFTDKIYVRINRLLGKNILIRRMIKFLVKPLLNLTSIIA